MEHTGNAAPAARSPTGFDGNALRDCLRAAEADANRFHGVHAPRPWHGEHSRSGLIVAAGLVFLGMAAGMLLLPDRARDEAVPAAVAATRPATSHWLTPPQSHAAPDAVPDTAPATPPAVAGAAVNGKPPALADTASPITLDGGDVDIATTMPASVLTGSEDSEAPRIAPMNRPTDPDEHDASPGQPDRVPDGSPS